MSSQSTNNNSRLLAIGAAVLVTGVILVLLILSRGDDSQAEPSPVATPSEQGQQQDAPTTATPQEPAAPLTPAQVAVARLPQPLEVPAGHEAMSVRVNFIRGIASVPTAGDHIKIYQLADGLEERVQVVVSDVEVLGLIGPLPQTNTGELTFLLSVEPRDVGRLMELSNAFEPQINEIEGHSNELWFTLLPSVDGPSDTSSDDATDGGTEPDQ